MESQEKEKVKNKELISRIIDFIFSNDQRKWLILIVLLGLFLRIVVASNVRPIADEMVHGTHAIDIISSGVINEQNECPVWFYLTDLSYMLFGVNATAGRFLSIFFGTLTILLVYLIGKNLFNEKIGLISAFLLSISAYHIRYALMEMDEAMIFFLLLSFYFFNKSLVNNRKISYFSIALMAIATLIKPIALPFILSFGLYFLFFAYKEAEKRKEFLRRNYKPMLLSVAIFLLFMTPLIAYNVILYQQKGIVDGLFSRFFKINQEIFSGLQGLENRFSFHMLFYQGLGWSVRDAFFDLDPAISILAAAGIILIFINKNYKQGRTLALIHLIPFIFLAGTSLLQTHFVSFIPLFSLAAAVFIFHISERLPHHLKKRFVCVLLVIILIINLYVLMPPLTSKSAIFKMRSFATSQIGERDIVVADARIYRGRIAWMFNDKAYIEASYFPQLLSLNQNISGASVPVDIYFIECAIDDCGWGTIKDQPDFNKSMEEMTDFFRNYSTEKKVISGGGGAGEKPGEEYFVVYKSQISIKSALYPLIYQTHDWFYYPVRWAKNDWYDKYTPNGTFQVILNSTGRLFLWAAVILAILSSIICFLEVNKSFKSK